MNAKCAFRINRLLLPMAVISASYTGGVLVSPIHAAEEPQAAVNVKLQKEEDRATVKREGDAALVTITSRTGIGRAEITPGKEWPKKIVLHLELRALEGFWARAGNTEVKTDLDRKTTEYLKYDAENRPTKVPDERWKLEIAREKEWIRVEMSTETFRGEKSLVIQWIDYYR